MKKLTLALYLATFSTTAMQAVAPANYYDSCDGLSGAQLLSELCNIVGNPKVVGYNGLWNAYFTTDVDENGRIWDIYSTKRWEAGEEQCGNYTAVGDCYNREHTVPQSWFNKQSPMVSDAFHVYPTDGKVNGQRSDFPYGECAGGSSVAPNGDVKPLGRLGKSTWPVTSSNTPKYEGKVFEPDNEYKGDIARSYFYMAAAYNDKVAGWAGESFGGNSYPAFSEWTVELLLKWHEQDPVSSKETARNEAIYAIQGNRNPFIDHPDMVAFIWGEKKSQGWHDATGTPVLSLPVDGSTVDFGTVAVGQNVEQRITVDGGNLRSAVTLSVDNNAFTLSTNSIPYEAANKVGGTYFTVTLKAAEAGDVKGSLTLKCGEITTKVNLTAKAINGIPALEATDVTSSSFVAHWVNLDDYETYQLDVKNGGASINGYPLSVKASLEQYEVTGLNPETAYTYTLSAGGRSSNVISVTTSPLMPEIYYTSDIYVTLKTEPATPSEAVEMWIETENITDDLNVSINTPFELSIDMNNWSNALEINPRQERFYVRVGATDAGFYRSAIRIAADDFINEDATVEATVAESDAPWFVEDFELAPEGEYASYEDKTYFGRVTDWAITDAGIYPSDTDHNGLYALRLGNKTTSSITSIDAKEGGIGIISFYSSYWSDRDGFMTLAVEYSPDGEQWLPIGDVEVTSPELASYTLEANVPGDNYIRLRQIGGKRGFIDDITVTDYHSGVGTLTTEDGWTAYCLNGNIAIVNDSETTVFSIYDLDGKTIACRTIGAGITMNFHVGAGLYIVTDGATSRRVLVL